MSLLSDDQAMIGLEMTDDRHLTVHTYNQAVADRIHRNLPRYAGLLAHRLLAMQARLTG